MRQVVLTAALLILAGVPARGQDPEPLAHIRDLYSNAAYEDVLSALAVDTAPPPPELGQYKVFSLIALGRDAEAERAAEAVIIANPRFQVDRDASPRVLDLFAKVRRRVAPELLKSMYLNAKAALDRKDRELAIQAFTELVAVTGDPDLKDDSVVGELRLLASGFLELSRALPVAAAAPSADKPAPPAPTTATTSIPPLPASIQRVTPPVPITETLPHWDPPPALARTEFRGRILLRIDAEGKVVSSEMLVRTTAFYDAPLVNASKQWRYQPALNNGIPIASERIVEFVLKPR